MKRPVLILGALAFIAIPTLLWAQSPERTVGLLGGPSRYDLSGTGTAPFLAFRLGLPVGGAFVAEPGIAYLTYDGEGGDRAHHVLPEVQLQVTRFGRRFSPYVGAGIGASLEYRPGADRQQPMLSAAAGTKLRLGGGWHFVVELRMRAIDPWVGTTADWGFGLVQRF